jgi:hypothetical protein
MSMTAEKLDTINACFGTYPQTQALKSGQIKSDRVDLRLTEVTPVYKATSARWPWSAICKARLTASR